MSKRTSKQKYHKNQPALPEYKAMIARAIQDTREAIEEALGLIRRFEDGPMTMTAALMDIRKEVDAIEQEFEVMKEHVDELRTLVARMRAQRDFAVRQRQDAFIMMRQKSEKMENRDLQ
jgi:hypothetical protein